MRRPPKSRRVRAEAWTAQPGWPGLVRTLAQKLEPRGRPAALAAFRIGRQSGRRRAIDVTFPSA